MFSLERFVFYGFVLSFTVSGTFLWIISNKYHRATDNAEEFFLKDPCHGLHDRLIILKNSLKIENRLHVDIHADLIHRHHGGAMYLGPWKKIQHYCHNFAKSFIHDFYFRFGYYRLFEGVCIIKCPLISQKNFIILISFSVEVFVSLEFTLWS